MSKKRLRPDSTSRRPKKPPKSRSKPKSHKPAASECRCRPVEQALQPEFFRALCDPARVEILCRLARCCQPQNVSQIASCCPTDISVVSRHLAMLRQAGILEAQKSGKQVHYSVRYSELAATLRQMADAIEACCPADASSSTEKSDD